MRVSRSAAVLALLLLAASSTGRQLTSMKTRSQQQPSLPEHLCDVCISRCQHERAVGWHHSQPSERPANKAAHVPQCGTSVHSLNRVSCRSVQLKSACTPVHSGVPSACPYQPPPGQHSIQNGKPGGTQGTTGVTAQAPTCWADVPCPACPCTQHTSHAAQPCIPAVSSAAHQQTGTLSPTCFSKRQARYSCQVLCLAT
jgi:hypothetical protein